jgi:hypothetical protein
MMDCGAIRTLCLRLGMKTISDKNLGQLMADIDPGIHPGLY